MPVNNGKIGAMDLQQFLNSRRAGVLAQQLSRSLPPRLGYWLADRVAGQISGRRDLPMLRNIRANQRVVRGELSVEQLDAAVEDVLRNIARAFYDLFHYADRPAVLQRFVARSQAIDDLILRCQNRAGGMIVCGLHMSNFDLAYQAVTSQGLRSIGLTMPDATEGIAWQHELRRRAGLEIMPASLSNLRHVIQRLKAGEIVVTGIDRPMAEVKCRPRFFGRPAQVPVHYVQLALRAGVPVMVMAAVMGEDGRCHVLASEPVELRSYSDRETEILANAERVLEIGQDFIRQAPAQWVITQPVWPEVLDERL
ncbi:MAG: hypothetical protein AB1894_12865 [Chloroflexota bacterium]